MSDRCRWIHRNVLYVVLAASACMSASCTFGREFRDAAIPSLQTGVTSILTGLVNGVFAAIEPEPDADGPNGG